MKLPIIAALSISALTLSSCGGAKPASTEAIVEVTPEKPRNTALEWSAASSDARFINRQLFDLATQRLASRINNGRLNQAVFIDASFLLLPQDATFHFFSEMRSPKDGFRPQELFEFARFEFDPVAMEFVRFCHENGVEIILTSTEMDSRAIIEELMKKNYTVQGSIVDGEPRYGRYSNNITLSEYAQQDRLALLLTTSLGEATALTGMGNPKSVEVDEMYKRFGSKVILFPNPTFNRK
jgi:predicted secreted acid phosphatase